MTKTDIKDAIEYLCGLYPRWQTTPQLVQLWGDMFAVPWLTPLSAAACIRKLRMLDGYNDPNPKALAEIMAGANREYHTARQDADRKRREDADASDPSRKTITGWATWYAGDGRAEWDALDPQIRRGLRFMWGEERRQDKHAARRVETVAEAAQ